MDIAFYISELLYENDCVIIPDFGGFVTHYVPAKIHPINHTFYPPGKNILFNSKLTRDDGLLLDFISEKNNISYTEAKDIVRDFIYEMNNQLEKKGIYRLVNIGTLHLDQENKLLFDPDDSVNYLENAFGLTSFISPAIIRKTPGKSLEKRFIDRKPLPQRNKEQRKKLAYALIIIPVLFIAGWFILQNDFFPENSQRTSMVSLEDESKSEVDKSYPDEIVIPPLKTLDFTGNESKTAMPAADPEIAKPLPAPPEKKYFIIGGAFSVEDNADKLVALLRRKGYDAERAGLSRSGLHMVSYFKTADKDEALINLSIIRKEDNPSAWLLKQ